MSPDLRGAPAPVVRDAIESGDSLPGSVDTGDDPLPGSDSGGDEVSPTVANRQTRGFAGEIDGRIVRDVLGRQPVYTEREDPSTWSFDPDDLDDPDLVPAGLARTPDGDERIWRLPDPDPLTDETVAVERVRTAVRESVDAVDAENLAVAFSGGVDSAAVAARLDAPLYVAGYEGSHDVEAARSAAAALGRDLQVVEITHEDIERAVPRVVEATGRTNAMDVQIAVPLFLVAERVAADGYDRLAVGQGADELFGGYAKVAKAPDDPRVEADTVRGARREVVESLPGQLERDVRTLRGAGVEPVAPLLADGVVQTALELPGRLLVADEERKRAFRRAVGEWVPDPVVDREKKALQYGSLVARELDRLARRAGYKRRMDDHVTKYVESIADAQ